VDPQRRAHSALADTPHSRTRFALNWIGRWSRRQAVGLVVFSGNF